MASKKTNTNPPEAQTILDALVAAGFGVKQIVVPFNEFVQCILTPPEGKTTNEALMQAHGIATESLLQTDCKIFIADPSVILINIR